MDALHHAAYENGGRDAIAHIGADDDFNDPPDEVAETAYNNLFTAIRALAVKAAPQPVKDEGFEKVLDDFESACATDSGGGLDGYHEYRNKVIAYHNAAIERAAKKNTEITPERGWMMERRTTMSNDTKRRALSGGSGLSTLFAVPSLLKAADLHGLLGIGVQADNEPRLMAPADVAVRRKAEQGEDGKNRRKKNKMALKSRKRNRR